LPKASGFAPSNPAFLFALFFCLLVLADPAWHNLLRNGDTFCHVFLGKYLLANLHAPPPDTLSYAEVHGSFLHEWLSESVMGGVDLLAGVKGIVFLFSALACASVALVFHKVDVRRVPPALGMFCVFALFFGAGIHFQARPHVFSMLLFVVYQSVLDQHQYDGPNRLWVLPPLMALWGNLHGGYVIGLLVICSYAGGNLLAWISGTKGAREKTRRTAIILALSAAAVLVNPHPWQTVAFPFQVVAGGGISTENIEFLSPDMHKLMFAPFFLLVLATFWAVGTAKRRMDYPEALLIAGMLAMSLYASRFTALYTLAAVPVIARRFPGREGAEPLRAKDLVFALAAIAVVAIGTSVAGKPYEVSNRQSQPAGAVAYLKSNDLPGKMFNHSNYAALILYETFPKYRVFIDNRADVFGPKRYALHNRIVDAEDGWREDAAAFGFDWIFVPADTKIAKVLSKDPGWMALYCDRAAVIYARVGSPAAKTPWT